MPSGPGVIDDHAIQAIAVATPPPVATFLLTSQRSAEGIAAHVAATGPSTVQIVSHIDPLESARLVRLIPNVRRVQVIHVEGPEAIELIDIYAPYVHAFLLDSGRPSLPVPELGGTGRVHDWEVSAEFVRRSVLPVFLAGGLTSENVAQAIREVRPFGLDLCSGVRVNSKLDPEKLGNFFTAVRNADVQVHDLKQQDLS
jgi:phosphoribosylanthranilate isomerase